MAQGSLAFAGRMVPSELVRKVRTLHKKEVLKDGR